MRAAACEQWRGAIAVDALGALEPEERLGLLAHLDGCAQCRETARELAQTASVLALVDRDDVGQTASVPPALAERVLGSLHVDAVSARWRRRARAGGALAAVGAIAATLALLFATGAPSGPTGRTEVLTGSLTTATATAVLSSRPWGTAISFTELGLAAGQVYTVAARTSSGAWWPTGSVTGVAGQTVTAPMSCNAQLHQITALRVTDANGRWVLWNLAPRGQRW